MIIKFFIDNDQIPMMMILMMMKKRIEILKYIGMNLFPSYIVENDNDDER